MSQPGKRKNKSLLDFYSKKSRDDSTENVTVCRDVKVDFEQTMLQIKGRTNFYLKNN